MDVHDIENALTFSDMPEGLHFVFPRRWDHSKNSLKRHRYGEKTKSSRYCEESTSAMPRNLSVDRGQRGLAGKARRLRELKGMAQLCR
jgi:hypothetical protein